MKLSCFTILEFHDIPHQPAHSRSRMAGIIISLVHFLSLLSIHQMESRSRNLQARTLLAGIRCLTTIINHTDVIPWFRQKLLMDTSHAKRMGVIK